MNSVEREIALLEASRCRRCAEKVGRTAILKGQECPHCGTHLKWTGGNLVERLEAQQGRWRLRGYGLVALASFLAGFVPLLQTLVQLVALFILHVVVLRRGLSWLTPKRRIFTRLSTRLFAGVIAALSLLINAMIAPLLGLSAVVLAFVGPLLTALYVEVGLRVLRGALRRDEEDQGLKFLEWAMPIGFALALLGMILAALVPLVLVVHWLSTAQVPSNENLVEILTGWLG